MGETVLTETLPPGRPAEIPTTWLRPGFYLYEIKGKNGAVKTGKVIKE